MLDTEILNRELLTKEIEINSEANEDGQTWTS